MEFRKMMMEEASDASGSGSGELFEFAQVSTKMQEILAVKNETVKMLDDLTHSLEEKVKNNSQSAAYGGDISAFWNSWNNFQESYAAFARYIESVDGLVSQAASKNAGLQETISGIMGATAKAQANNGGAASSTASTYNSGQ